MQQQRLQRWCHAVVGLEAADRLFQRDREVQNWQGSPNYALFEVVSIIGTFIAEYVRDYLIQRIC